MLLQNIKTFEELREWVYREKEDCLEAFIDDCPDMDNFTRGRYYGEIQGYNNLMECLRSILKYGDVDS